MKQLLLIACTVAACMSTNAQPGTLDKTFGNNGTYVTTQRFFLTLPAIQLNDGRIIKFSESALIAFLSNGLIDSSFGENGFVSFNTTDFFASAIAAQPDNKILIGGGSGQGNQSDVVLMRYDSKGNIDKSFGKQGKTVTDCGGFESLSALIVNYDGKITGTGRWEEYSGANDHPASNTI